MKKIIFLSKQIKDLGSKIFLWSILVVCILNSLLLAFAYRDFSWGLMLMAFFSTVLLPICVWFFCHLKTPHSSGHFSIGPYLLPAGLPQVEC